VRRVGLYTRNNDVVKYTGPVLCVWPHGSEVVGSVYDDIIMYNDIGE